MVQSRTDIAGVTGHHSWDGLQTTGRGRQFALAAGTGYDGVQHFLADQGGQARCAPAAGRPRRSAWVAGPPREGLSRDTGPIPRNKWRFIRGLRFAAWAVTAVPGPLGTKDNQLLMGGHVQGLCQSPYQGELTAAIQHQRPVRLWCDCQGVVRGLTHLLQRRVLKKNAPHSNLFHTHWEFPVLCRLQVELPALLDASEALRTFPWSQSFEVVSVQYCFFCAGVQLGATFDAPKVSDTHTHWRPIIFLRAARHFVAEPHDFKLCDNE